MTIFEWLVTLLCCFYAIHIAEHIYSRRRRVFDLFRRVFAPEPASTGFFSVVQFYPRLDSGEAVNAGVVLYVPSVGFLDIKMSYDNDYGRFGFKLAMEGRVRSFGMQWKTAEDMRLFSVTEGPHLRLSAPLAVTTENPAAELLKLYERLVASRQLARPRITAVRPQ